MTAEHRPTDLERIVRMTLDHAQAIQRCIEDRRVPVWLVMLAGMGRESIVRRFYSTYPRWVLR